MMDCSKAHKDNKRITDKAFILLEALIKIANCNEVDCIKYITEVDSIALDAIDKARGEV